MDRFCEPLVVKCQLLSNANFSRSSMNLNSSAEHSVIYEIFIVWNQVFAIYMFQVAQGATPTFKVSGDMLEVNICGFLRCI